MPRPGAGAGYTTPETRGDTGAQGQSRAGQGRDTTFYTPRKKKPYEWGEWSEAYRRDLKKRAEGAAGPSVAEIRAREAAGLVSGAQYGLAAGRPGYNAAASMRGAGRAAGMVERGTEQYVTGLRQTEQAQASEAYRNFMMQREAEARGIAFAQSQQDFAAAQSRANTQAQNTAAFLSALGAVIGGVAGISGGPAGVMAGATIGGTVGGAVGRSDEDTKTNKRPAGKDAREFLDNLDTKKYDQKPEYGGEKDLYGGMAQSALKSKMGRSYVEQGADGTLMVDAVKGFGAVLTAQKDMHERLKKLEGIA